MVADECRRCRLAGSRGLAASAAADTHAGRRLWQRHERRRRRAVGEQLLARRGGAGCGWRVVWRESAAVVGWLETSERSRLRGRPRELGSG